MIHLLSIFAAALLGLYAPRSASAAAPTPYDVDYFQDADQLHDYNNHTVVFWINGDADRFRPEAGIGSDVVRLDKLDVAEIRKYSGECQCNIVLFVDQRGSDSWYTNSEHFASKLYVYSRGEAVTHLETVGRLGAPTGPYFRKVAAHYYEIVDKFSEVNEADEGFLTGLLQFSDFLFPGTKTHLVYRGHAFAVPRNLPADQVTPFDYSNPETPYGIDPFVNSVRASGVHLSSVTFASCGMSYISLALGLMPYVDTMIATQVNIPETGITGFSSRYLTQLNDETRPADHATHVLRTMLERFKTVDDKSLFIRETPLAAIDLQALRPYRGEIGIAKAAALQALQADPARFERYLIAAKVSERYVRDRVREGLSPKVVPLIQKKMVFKGVNTTAYDLISVLREIGQTGVADRLSGAIALQDMSSFSGKTGLSVDVTFD